MLCIVSKYYNPAFNLAAEEYLFKNFEEDIFFLYINSPAVVIGKHQNALAEINPEFIRENDVKVIRRLSGGGAVYHDEGNLNFSFHQTVADTSKISFKSFNEPIIDVLKQLNVNAEISKRNDIFVNEFKVSGHAEHVFRNRILSHGTLLFNANRENLSTALKNTSGTYKGKAIQSVRSKVANITEFLSSPLSINEFTQKIKQHILNLSRENKEYDLSLSDIDQIEKLAAEKYSQWGWNFGYSPKYNFEKNIVFESGSIGIGIKVEKGIITELTLQSDVINQETKKAIQLKLLNSPHEYQVISQLFKTLKPDLQNALLNCLF